MRTASTDSSQLTLLRIRISLHNWATHAQHTSLRINFITLDGESKRASSSFFFGLIFFKSLSLAFLFFTSFHSLAIASLHEVLHILPFRRTLPRAWRHRVASGYSAGTSPRFLRLCRAKPRLFTEA